MHAILAAIFATIFSFCHASTNKQALDMPVNATNDQVTFTASAPDTTALANVPAVYAEGSCSSCRMTNISYSVR